MEPFERTHQVTDPIKIRNENKKKVEIEITVWKSVKSLDVAPSLTSYVKVLAHELINSFIFFCLLGRVVLPETLIPSKFSRLSDLCRFPRTIRMEKFTRAEEKATISNAEEILYHNGN